MTEKPARKKSNVDHLKPYQWKKGQSGNPSGLPKGRINLTARIRRELLRATQDGQVADALAKKVVYDLLSDPVKMQRILLAIIERDEGPVDRGPLVEVHAGNGRAPELPPPERQEKGGMTLSEHLQTLMRLAKERGVRGIVEGPVTDADFDHGESDELADLLS